MRDICAEAGLPPQPTFPDDQSKLSTAYKSLGQAHVVGKTKCSSTRYRASLICACNCDEWPMLRLACLESEQLDWLLYFVSRVRPDIKTASFASTFKRQSRAGVRRQHAHLLLKNDRVCDGLMDGFENLLMMTVQVGYPVKLLSPQAAQEVARYHMSQVPGGVFQRPGLARNPPRHATPFIEDAGQPAAANGGGGQVDSRSRQASASTAPVQAWQEAPSTETASGARPPPVSPASPPGQPAAQPISVQLKMPELTLPGFGTPLPAGDAPHGKPGEDGGAGAEKTATSVKKRGDGKIGLDNANSSEDFSAFPGSPIDAGLEDDEERAAASSLIGDV